MNLEIREAYENLKAALLQEGGKIVAKEPTTSISFNQGSLWGVSPRTAKKVVRYRFYSEVSRTRIVVSSSLSQDWKNLTIIGCVISVVIAALCWWISIDLERFIGNWQPSSWSWIVATVDYTNLELAQAYVGLTRGLAVFLVVVIFVEVGIYVYAKSRIDSFAEDTLRLLD